MSRKRGDTRFPRGPGVDDAALRTRDDCALIMCDVVHFSRTTQQSRFFDKEVVVSPEFGAMKKTLPIFGPAVDVKADSRRLKLHGYEHTIQHAPSMVVSVLVHLLIVSIWAASIFHGGFLRDRLRDDATPIEVSFGMTLEPQSVAPTKLNEGLSPLDLEATKTAQQLPQLTKNFAVESAEKPADAMPVPTPTVTAQPTAAAPAPTPVVAQQATPAPGVRTLKADEISRRLEREKRVVGAKEKAGTHQKGGKGVRDALSALPADPFATMGSGSSRLTMGSPDGKLSAGAQAYQLAALAHLKKSWSLSDFQRFDAALSCQLEVALNMFGKVLSTKIVRSSGDAEFDEYAQSAVSEADPFPDFSDEKLQRRTLVLSFRPRDVK